jgi:hypothetical protein
LRTCPIEITLDDGWKRENLSPDLPIFYIDGYLYVAYSYYTNHPGTMGSFNYTGRLYKLDTVSLTISSYVIIGSTSDLILSHDKKTLYLVSGAG